MFDIKTRRINASGIVYGNDYLPESGTIDISSSNSSIPISINGIVPAGASDSDSITGITIKGGDSSMGVIGSITKAVDLPFGPTMSVGDSGTIDHVPLNPLATKASVTVATIGSLNILDTTAFPISQVGFSEFFLDNTPYTFTQTTGAITSGTVTFSIPVPGGPINSMAITNPGVGYDSNATGKVETSASATKKELSFAIDEVYATVSIVSGGTLYDTNLGSPGYIIAFVGGAYGVIPSGDYSLALDFCGEGYSVKKYAIVRGSANTALMEVLTVDSVGAVRSYLLDSTAIGKDYSVGEATIQDLATPLLNPATFIIDSVSGSGGGSYTDAQAITALTTSTSPYVVNQTINGDLTITGALTSADGLVGELAITTGNLYVDVGDAIVTGGDLQVQSGDFLNVPQTTILTDAQFGASWTLNADATTYTLKRNSVAIPTTEQYLLLDSATRQEVASQTFFNNAEGLEVRNKVELVDTNNPGGFAKIELDHIAPADNVNIPIHHFSFVKSGEATGVPQMALSSDILMIRDGDVLVDDVTHTPLETRGKPPNKYLGYNTTSGEISYINNSIELKQPFVGSGAPVPVGGTNRGVIADTHNISSATITGTYKYYSADKFQVMIISYGTKFKVVFSGELLIGDTYTANDSVKAIQWDTELAYYFGDPTATQLINTGSAGSRPYGPRTDVFLPMTRRIASSSTYEIIAVEIHNQRAGGGTSNNYFMRFNTDLAIGDRLLFDGVEYWTESTA